MYKVWEVKRMYIGVYRRVLDCSCGASKLCTSMCLRSELEWPMEGLSNTRHTVATLAMQYANFIAVKISYLSYAEHAVTTLLHTML